MSLDDFNYRNSGRIPSFAIDIETVSPQDEIDYSTLKSLRKELKDQMIALREGFDTLALIDQKGADVEVTARTLLFEMKVNKEVYSILSDILSKINKAIDAIEFNINP